MDYRISNIKAFILTYNLNESIAQKKLLFDLKT
jgi:hypothetical protein